jgi:hypothetical protein
MAEKKAAGGLPFVGNMTDGIDFVRKMWGVTGLPGLPGMPSTAGITQFAQGLPGALPSMITPTLDIGELDKRIADLRAVEQWLALNANMLRATIQSLEVQRNTIATLKSFGGSMLASVTRGGSHDDTPGEAYLRHAEERGVARRQATAAATAAAAIVPPVSMPAPAAPTKRTAPRARGKVAKKNAGPSAAAMPLNPAVWWGALQDQFVRAAAAAAAAEPPKAAKRAAPAAAAPAPTRRVRKRAQG